MNFKKRFSANVNSIKTKLIISFLVITLTPLIYMSYTLLSRATEGLLNMTVSGSMSHARKASIDLNKLIKGHEAVLQPLFSDCSLTADRIEETKKLITEYDNTYTFIERIYLLDQNYEMLGVSNSNRVAHTVLETDLKAITPEQNVVLYYTKTSTMDGSAAIIKKLYSQTGEVRGYCIIELNILEFNTVLSENVVGNSVRAFLIDSKDNVVAKFPEKALETDLAGMREQITGRDYGAFTISSGQNRKKAVVATFLPVVGYGWKLLMIQDQNEVYALVGNFQTQLYWLLFFTIIVAVIIALTISQNIALPILQVTRSANELAAGKYDVRIKVKNSDEVGQLASNFNVMADSLTGKMKELKEAYDELKRRANTIESKNVELDRKVFETTALYSIGHTMGEVGINMDRLMDVIIQRCVEVAGVERGYLLLMSEDLEFLELRRLYALDGTEFKMSDPSASDTPINVKPSEGVTGKVAQTGQMMTINDLYKDPDFRQYELDNAPVFNVCCIPLKVNNATLGVINLVNRRNGGRFEKQDTDLLQTMANQAALFLDNTKLFKLAITDGLTGLFLVRHFKNKLAEEIKRAKRYKKVFSLLFIDIDHFKKFNDTYGHQIGDEVLKQTAAIFKSSFRDGIDLPSRYGGEEMIALLPETDIEGAFIVAERLRQKIEQHKYTGYTVPLHVTISVGLSEFPVHDTDGLGLIRKADTALYKSKENGRNRTTRYSNDFGEVSEK